MLSYATSVLWRISGSLNRSTCSLEVTGSCFFELEKQTILMRGIELSDFFARKKHAARDAFSLQ